MDRLMAHSMKAYQSKFAGVIQETLAPLFPIMLLGSFAEVLKYSFLTPSGFVATIFGITKWLPAAKQISQLLGLIVHCTVDMIALYGAYGVTYSTTKAYGRQTSALSGAIGLLAFLMVTYQPHSHGQLLFNRTLMGQGLLIALMIGYIVGRIIVTFEKRRGLRSYQIIWPLLLVAVLSIAVNVAVSFIRSPEVQSFISSTVMHAVSANALSYVVGMGLLTDLLSWMAVGGPFSVNPTFTDPAELANLNHALKTGSAFNVPFQYTDVTLFHSFANFGGNGAVLAMIIAILIFSKRRRFLTVSRWSIFPALFNNNYAMMLGIPIVYNPVFLIPFLLAPLVNMIVAAVFLALKWIPAAVYPVPAGAPGPLIGFLGTNGNWLALILGAFLILIDVLIYMPFVKLYDRLDQNRGEQ
ncbi:PTS transporter subunit EIIC [Lentilactobacillus parakefiri]|uniref:Permease IIC component n=1 Tax=Lentilactobacillus parakefiri TaxID=152332 RepID=A0A269YLC8_9LACO|nr:PTS transporter subunit EIIC [Lentilactobacillus parakefiri]PAK86367.1 PTS trehalose transporter subunit IIBC [Lentilactobacillus parakefiri]